MSWKEIHSCFCFASFLMSGGSWRGEQGVLEYHIHDTHAHPGVETDSLQRLGGSPVYFESEGLAKVQDGRVPLNNIRLCLWCLRNSHSLARRVF